MTIRASTGVIVAMLLSGCASRSLEITPFATNGTGHPYQLNFTQFTVKAKWRLIGCSPSYTFAVEANATPVLRPDPMARYLLQPASLEGWMNTADFTTTYDEAGGFKSLNSKIDDKTVETFSGIAKGVVQLATVGLGLLSAIDPACDRLVSSAKVSEAATKAASKEIERLRREILAIQADPALTDLARERQLALLKPGLTRQEAILSDLAKTLEHDLKAVTFEETFQWPQSGAEVHLFRPLNPEAWGRWSGGGSPPSDLGLELSIRLADSALPGQDANRLVLTKGLPLRIPRPGTLVIERVTPSAAEPKAVVAEVEASIIQSGDVLYMPVQRRPLRSTTASVSLHPNGQIASLGRGQSSAPGETLGKILDTAGAQAKALADLETTELEALQAENTLLGARKTNAELKAALQPGQAALELAAINGELTLKTAQINLIKADQTLATLPSPAP